MSLSQFIRDNTNGGADIAGVLIDVMNGRIDGTKVSHRLTAARLLTIYGYGDVDDFTDANAPVSSRTVRDDRVWVIVDSDLTRLIKTNTDDGHAVCLFLIEVMYGKVEGANVGHRLSAAKELLNRGFGKIRNSDLPKLPGSKTPRRSTTGKHRKHVMPPEAVDFEARLAERVAAINPDLYPDTETTQTGPTHQPVASVRPEPSRRELVEGQSARSTETATLDEPEPQPDHSVSGVEPIYLDSDLLMAFDGCEDPNFDPYRAIHDSEYARTYSACPDPECEVHGNPPEFDFDPNDYHY